MALYRIIVRMKMGAGGAEDVATWSHGCDLTSLPTEQGLADLWSNALASTAYGQALRAQLPAWATRTSIELAPATSGASVLFAPLAGQLGVGSNPLSSSTALPLIALVAGPRGPAAGARWMIGPLAGGSNNGRPTTAQLSAVLGYGKALHLALGVYGGGLVVLRDQGATADPITAFSVGNSYGYIGRRRLEVTQRTSLAV